MMITSTSSFRGRLLMVVGLSLFAIGALAYEWTYQHKPLRGVYATYGGGLGDPWQPTQADHKIMFSIDGPAAKAMFDGMGPDVKEICSPEDGKRVRKRDGEKLYCMRSKRGAYQCTLDSILELAGVSGGSFARATSQPPDSAGGIRPSGREWWKVGGVRDAAHVVAIVKMAALGSFEPRQPGRNEPLFPE